MNCTVAIKTTGLNKAIHDVIEIAIKPFGESEIAYRMRPTHPESYEEGAQKANGMSVQVVNAFPLKEEVLPRVLADFRNISAIGHFFKFDYEFIYHCCGKEFTDELFGKNKPIDTAMMIERINLATMERGEVKKFSSAALRKVASQLEIPWSTKCEVIEKVYKRISDGN